MAVDTKNMTEGNPVPILIKFALHRIGADLVLVPTFIYLYKTNINKI